MMKLTKGQRMYMYGVGSTAAVGIGIALLNIAIISRSNENTLPTMAGDPNGQLVAPAFPDSPYAPGSVHAELTAPTQEFFTEEASIPVLDPSEGTPPPTPPKPGAPSVNAEDPAMRAMQGSRIHGWVKTVSATMVSLENSGVISTVRITAETKLFLDRGAQNTNGNTSITADQIPVGSLASIVLQSGSNDLALEAVFVKTQ